MYRFQHWTSSALLASMLCGCGAPPAAHDRDHQVNDSVVANSRHVGLPPDQRLFMDVHHLGPGAVTVADVAGAHQKDLAVQCRHGVDYREYWVDERTGTIYCLVAAPDAALAHTVHKEAHGLLADELVEVESRVDRGASRGTGALFMATYLSGPTPTTQHTAAGDRHGVTVLRLWTSARTGRSHSLIEAPDREAALAFFADLGAAPQVLHEVVRGR